MRYPFPSLLRLILLLGACAGFSIGWAAESDLDCKAMAKQALDLRTFRQVVDVYANLRGQPKAASALLVCLQSTHPELAETLLLHQRRLMAPGRLDVAVTNAFLHYVINTKDPKLADTETADLEGLIRTYRQSLLRGDKRNDESTKACYLEPSSLKRLRCLGRRANYERYGRADVVPVELLEFDASADVYSTVNATWMAEMSALAYWDSDLIDQQLRRWDYRLYSLIHDPQTETLAFMAVSKEVLVLSFRGTSGFENFLTDGNFLRVGAKGVKGEVHRGFKTALDAVWPEIVSKLRGPDAQKREIWLTGHSLGAALAQLAALRLTKAGYRVHSVYTFGTPRIGDKDFVAGYDQLLGGKTFPHINHQDVVTRVPPERLGFRATASTNIRQFPGTNHVMKKLVGESGDDPKASTDWRSSVRKAISETTSFLPGALRHRALVSEQPVTPARANFYSANFERGPLDDHGSFEYLFKLVCASIEYDLWPREKPQSSAKPDDVRRP